MADDASADLLAKFVKWVEDFEDETKTARQLAEKDRDFYDGIQWTSDETKKLEKRNQPIVTYNRIAPKINYLRGYEMKTRIDPRAFPRNPAHEDAAMAITDALRFVADTENFDEVRSSLTEHLLIEGYGGCVVEPEVVERAKPVDYRASANPVPGGLELVEESSAEIEKTVEIRLRKIHWDRIFYDPRSREPDFSDAKYLGTVDWWHLDDAQADPMFAGQSDILAEAVTKEKLTDETLEDRPHSQWTTADPPRLRICQVFYTEKGEWMTARFCRSAILTGPEPVGLEDEYGKSYCPLKLASSFVDRENRRYGVVRSMISAQEEINKRRSKALHLLTFRQVIYEEDAVEQINEFREEIAKPDGLAKVNRGALSEERLQIANTTDMLQGQMQLLQDAKVEIDAVGPEAPMVGEDRRVQSGRALQFRLQTGTMQLEPIFDSLRSWQKRVFHAIWYQIRQFKTEEWWIRVTDDNERRGFRFVALNQPMRRSERLHELISKDVPLMQAMDMLGIQPVIWRGMLQQAQQMVQQHMQQVQAQAQQTGQQIPQIDPKQMAHMVASAMDAAPQMAEVMTVNDVGAIGCDVVIDASPDTTVLQQEEYSELVEMAQANPGAIPPEVIIQASQLRNKRELLTMMEKKPDPTLDKLKELEVLLKQAEVEKTKAQAMDEMASAQQRMGHQQSMQADVPLKQAKAMEHAAKAGSQTMPLRGPGGF